MNIVTIPDYTPAPRDESGRPKIHYEQANCDVVNMLHKVFRGWDGQIDGVECRVNWYRLPPTIATLTRENVGLLHTERNLDGSPLAVPRNDKAWMKAQMEDVNGTGATDPRAKFRAAAKDVFDNM